jgi:two-component system cell cycle response regulator DivK
VDMIKFAKVGCELSREQQPLVLVVDDNEDNLVLLSFVVEQLNCQIITAGDGQTTLELAQSCQPILILLDIMLPDLNGMEVVAHLRQNPLTKAIPIIAVTAMASEQDRDRILLAGCNAYVSKPYYVDELEKLLICYLDQNLPSN